LEATGAAQGLADATENVPDLIVVGGKISDGDQVRLCADFKQHEITSHIPVILLSPDGSDTSQVRALKAGVDDVLGIPFRLPILRARVDNLLENRRKLHEHFQQLRTVQPRELAMNQVDAEFLRRVVEIVEKNLADYEFDMEKLARQMAVSRRQLFRKFKALAGCTPNVFIRDIRLKRAAHLLRDSHLTVSEIIYAVGFSDPKYFRNIFRERFGVLPGEYNEQTKR
jgi:AraC-like DNA-binding protein